MADAIYLLSSLPHIDLDMTNDSLMSMERFLYACDVLGDELSVKVKDAVIDPKNSEFPIAKEWAEYDYSIRNELAKKRWAALKSGSYHSILVNDGVPVSAEGLDIAQEVGHEQSPLAREKAIITHKWTILDTLDARFEFSVEKIIIYGWKLQLYYSYRNLTEERGQTQWSSLLTVLAEKSGFSISAINGGLNG